LPYKAFRARSGSYFNGNRFIACSYALRMLATPWMKGGKISGKLSMILVGIGMLFEADASTMDKIWNEPFWDMT
jgi:hypothetical protein